MKRQIRGEAAIGLGLLVWLVAATILPFQMGAGGAPWSSLLLYVAIAGALFAAGDAALQLSYSSGLSDISAQGLMRALGLAIPAAAMFALGTLVAPTAQSMEDDVCHLGGFDTMDERTTGPDWDMDADADCVPAD